MNIILKSLMAPLLVLFLSGLMCAQRHHAPQSTAEPPTGGSSSNLPPGSGASSIAVTGLEPLFLDTVGRQTIHLAGVFPSDVEVGSVQGNSISDVQIAAVSKADLFMNLTVNLLNPGKVSIQLLSGSDVTLVSLVIRPAPCPELNTSAQTFTAPGSRSLCTLPASGFAVNAMTRDVSDKVTGDVCSAHPKSSSLKLRNTYLLAKDSTRIVVCNKNPFNYSTTLVLNTKPIQDDDLTTFLGVLNPTLGASQAATKASDNASSNSAAKSAVVSPRTFAVRPTTPTPAPITFNISDTIQSCVAGITDKMRTVDQTYSDFVSQYENSKTMLEDDGIECANRVSVAKDLWQRAATIAFSPQIRNIDQQISGLLSEVQLRTNVASSGPYKDSSLTTDQVTSMKAAKGALTTQSCVAQKAFGLISANIIQGVIAPVSQVLGHSGSFVYISKPLGPFQQPTQADWQLNSNAIDKKDGGLIDSAQFASDPYADCLGLQPTKNPAPSNDQTNPQTPTQHSSAAFLLQRHTPHLLLSTMPQTKPKGANTTAESAGTPTTSGTAAAPANTPTDSQSSTPQSPNDGPSGTILFGAPRFVVSTGIAGAILRKQEFQKAIGQALDTNKQPIAGQASVNTIQFKTNSLARISPLVLAHTRIWQYRGSDNALWATVGVTGKPDNQGTSPEYLIGISQGFWSNLVFLTGGLYVGEKQQLTPGLFVGEAVPSSLTGDITVQKNYKAGFGLALSFRIPKTSTPKTQPANPNSTGTKSGSKPSNPNQ